MTTELSNLPEGCVANFISLTTPRDACRFTVVSTLFRSATDSDAVWERLLPSDHQDIIAQSDEDTRNQLILMFRNLPKKQFFMRLAESPIVIDAGRKSFFVDKASGKKCFMIAAREMAIVWGDSPSYWEWISLPDSRFREVAQLRNVCWLEMSVRIESSLLSPNTRYVAYLVFKLTDNSHGLEHTPVETSVGLTDGVKTTKSIFLASEDDVNRQMQIIPRYGRLFLFDHHVPHPPPPPPRVGEASSAENGTTSEYPKRRADGWMEAELGEVFVYGGDNGDMVEVSVTEVKHGHWKRGLVVEGIEFRPKA